MLNEILEAADRRFGGTPCLNSVIQKGFKTPQKSTQKETTDDFAVWTDTNSSV